MTGSGQTTTMRRLPFCQLSPAADIAVYQRR